jgi:transcriptional regulator with XRE-family HTH domain
VEVGERIRELRKVEGISQERLARRADISLNVLNRIETGAVTNPHWTTILSVADALGISVADLVEGDRPKDQAPSPSEISEGERRSLQLATAMLEGIFHPIPAHFYNKLPKQPELGEWKLAKNIVEMQATYFTNFLDVLGRQSISKKAEEYYRAGASNPIPDEVQRLRDFLASAGNALRGGIRWVLEHDPEAQLDMIDDYVEKWASERFPELAKWEEQPGVGGSRGS